MMAAAGDDLQTDAREEIQDANTEVLPDPDNESSDDDDDKEVSTAPPLSMHGSFRNRVLIGDPRRRLLEWAG